ncbi:MAG: ATP-binding protein [Candidatus Aenigmarchaeota archaeon]|nr:ATP-binding protein [Candidatus Aenigmarchaeota archaeon]
MSIEEILRILNEWWITEKVKEELAPAFRRDTFKQLEEMVDVRQIVVLTGLRRVGKTTLFYQLIQDLIKRIEPKHILYFSFDEKVEELKRILDEYQKITGVDWKREKIYVFFDEIHKLESWSSKLKLLYDAFPNIKFFVSGSSSVELEKEAYSNLVGRHYLLKIEPLSLKEFFELKTGKKVENFEIWREELFLAFSEYLKKPFPEIVFENNEKRIMEYLKENVIGKIIYQDLPKKFKNANEDLLFNLIEIFYQNPGMILNLDNLAKNLHVAKKTLQKHLFYLKFSYLIRSLKNFRISMLMASRKLQKIYPYHWSLMFGLYREIERGKLLECVASSLLDAKFYWRKGNKEIDFILKNREIIPVEAKVKCEIDEFAKVLRRINLNKAILLYEGKYKEVKSLGNVQIEIIPFFELAFYGFSKH